MATKVYTGINNLSKDVSSIYIGVNNSAKKVLKGYIGINNKAKLFYNSDTTPEFLENYTQVEYITSYGGAYIKTGIFGKYSYDFKYILYNEGPILFSMTTQLVNPQRVVSASSNTIRYFNYSTTFSESHGSTAKQILYNISTSSSPHNFIVTSEPSGVSQSFYTNEEDDTSVLNNNELVLFASTYAQEDGTYTIISQTQSIVLYYFKIFSDNSQTNLIANFIPCKRNIDSKPGLYDTVRKIFYTNANSTGYFNAGSEVTQ